jgi:hypothetical protein
MERGPFIRSLFASIALLALPVIACANVIPLGYLSYDVTVPGQSAQFDITNQTGPNSTPYPDQTWPVASSIPFTITSLTVNFNDGSTSTFGPSYFTLGPDGLSLFGNAFDISGSNPQPTGVTLAGTIPGSTFLLNDSSVWAPISPPALTDLTGAVNPSIFDATGPCSSGPPAGCLQDGDLVVIAAQAVAVPEPSTAALLLVVLTITGISRAIVKGGVA